MALYRRTGKRHADLLSPPVPSLWRQWVWYCELASRRVPGEPISWTDIASWSRLTGRDLSPQDIECFNAIDAEYFLIRREHSA